MVISIVSGALFAVLRILASRNMSKYFKKVLHRTALNASNGVSFLFECSRASDHSAGDDRVARSARPVRVGTLRPAIVLYDEPHPLGDDIATIQTADLSKRPDLLIIMGTSLKVHGLKKLVKEFAKAVKQGSIVSSASAPKVVFVNKTAPASEWSSIIDLHVEGTTDAWVERVVADWKHARPADWEIQPKIKTVVAATTAKPRPAVNAMKAKGG